MLMRSGFACLSLLALIGACGPSSGVYEVPPQQLFTAVETKSFAVQGLSSRQRAFNASIVAQGNERFVSFRVDGALYDRKQQQQLAFVAVDAESRPRGDYRILATPIGATGLSSAEDPRLFVHQDGLYIIYNAKPVVQGNADQRRMFLGRIKLDHSQAVPTGSLVWARQLATPPDLQQARWEKNWTPFSADGEIHLIYRANSPLVLKLDRSALDAIEQQAIENPLPARPAEPAKTAGLAELSVSLKRVEGSELAPIPEVAGSWRGGTPAIYVPELGEFVTFFHTRCVADYKTGIGRRVYYLLGFYTFKPKPPFAISRYVPEPLQIAENQSTPAGWTRVFFPAGIVEDADSFLVSYGKDDISNGLARFDKRALVDLLVAADGSAPPGPADDGNSATLWSVMP